MARAQMCKYDHYMCFRREVEVKREYKCVFSTRMRDLRRLIRLVKRNELLLSVEAVKVVSINSYVYIVRLSSFLRQPSKPDERHCWLKKWKDSLQKVL